MVEPQIVVLVVAGSSPVGHPKPTKIRNLPSKKPFHTRVVKIFEHAAFEEITIRRNDLEIDQILLGFSNR